jgi:hypothetical protein
MLKIDGAASTGGQDKLTYYAVFLAPAWGSTVFPCFFLSWLSIPTFSFLYKHGRKPVHIYKLTSDALVTIIYIYLYGKTLQISFKLCRRQFPTEIAFGMTISLKGRRLILLQYVYRRLFYPMVSCMWHLIVPLHLTASVLQLSKGVDSV